MLNRVSTRDVGYYYYYQYGRGYGAEEEQESGAPRLRLQDLTRGGSDEDTRPTGTAE